MEVAVLGSPPFVDIPYGLCGRKATLTLNSELRSCVKVEVAVQGSTSFIDSPYGLCGRKATLNLNGAERTGGGRGGGGGGLPMNSAPTRKYRRDRRPTLEQWLLIKVARTSPVQNNGV